MTEKNNYYEVLYYTGETEYDAMNGDFTAIKFETKNQALNYVKKHLEKSKDIFGIFVTSRDYEDEIIDVIIT